MKLINKSYFLKFLFLFFITQQAQAKIPSLGELVTRFNDAGLAYSSDFEESQKLEIICKTKNHNNSEINGLGILVLGEIKPNDYLKSYYSNDLLSYVLNESSVFYTFVVNKYFEDNTNTSDAYGLNNHNKDSFLFEQIPTKVLALAELWYQYGQADLRAQAIRVSLDNIFPEYGVKPFTAAIDTLPDHQRDINHLAEDMVYEDKNFGELTFDSWLNSQSFRTNYAITPLWIKYSLNLSSIKVPETVFYNLDGQEIITHQKNYYLNREKSQSIYDVRMEKTGKLIARIRKLKIKTLNKNVKNADHMNLIEASELTKNLPESVEYCYER